MLVETFESSTYAFAALQPYEDDFSEALLQDSGGHLAHAFLLLVFQPDFYRLNAK